MCQCGGLTEILDNTQGQDSWKGQGKPKRGKQRLPVLLTWGGQFAVGEEQECATTPSQIVNQQQHF